MCGRYYVNKYTWGQVEEDFPDIAGKLQDSELSRLMDRGTARDIMPAMPALSLAAGGGAAVTPAALTWGFPGFDGKKLIINARAEGIEGKPTFADSIRLRRCVLPAAGFYEWDRKKEKVTFTDPNAPVIYLAGSWRPYGAQNCFVIITRGANESMLPVHDRMPLMIAKEDVRDWLFDSGAAADLLARPLPQLEAKRDYEQLSLF